MRASSSALEVGNSPVWQPILEQIDALLEPESMNGAMGRGCRLTCAVERRRSYAESAGFLLIHKIDTVAWTEILSITTHCVSALRVLCSHYLRNQGQGTPPTMTPCVTYGGRRSTPGVFLQSQQVDPALITKSHTHTTQRLRRQPILADCPVPKPICAKKTALTLNPRTPSLQSYRGRLSFKPEVSTPCLRIRIDVPLCPSVARNQR